MTYAKGRYYDMELALFSQVDPPLANGTYMGRKPGENSVWTKAGANLNGYWYVMANPVVYTDPSGLEPTIKNAGNLQGLSNTINTEMGGYLKGRNAIKALNFESGYWGYNKGSILNEANDRYIFSNEQGWIDMRHFTMHAAISYSIKRILSTNPENAHIPEMAYNLALRAGELKEIEDCFGSSEASAYSYEDLNSNRLGALFGAYFFDPTKDKTLGEQLEAFLSAVVNPVDDPSTAPNYRAMPYSANDARSLQRFLTNETYNPRTPTLGEMAERTWYENMTKEQKERCIRNFGRDSLPTY